MMIDALVVRRGEYPGDLWCNLEDFGGLKPLIPRMMGLESRL